MTRILIATLVAAFTCCAVSVQAQGVPGADPNKCLAGKNKCVSKKIAGLMKCREKCQKKPDKCGVAQAECEQKVMDKFDGGAKPEKGCFAKLEAKANPEKPDSLCTTTGDTASMEAEVDAATAELLARLEGTPAPTCGDGAVNVVGEQCDGADLNGASCVSLGHSAGVLACDLSCGYDASGCFDCASSGGVVVAGACWFAGAVGGDCDSACSAAGLTYDDATRTYAGSGGNNANCLAVLDALGAGAGVINDTFNLDPTGCAVRNGDGVRFREALASTTSSATVAAFFRACACN